MNPLARIASLSAAFLCSNMARAGIGLALALVLGRGLGVDRFGTWILCTAWASTLTAVVDLGLGALLTRDGARSDSDPGALASGALLLRLTAAVPLALALAVAASWMSSDPEAVTALRAAAFLGVAGSAYGCFGALLRAQPRWLPTILAVETAWLAAQVPASWWLVAGGCRVSGLVALAAALQLAQIASALALWDAVFGGGTPVFRRVPAWRPLLRRALPFAMSGLVANLHARAAALMLGALATPLDIGWFGAASRVARAVKLAPQAVFAGALPVLAHEFGRDEASAARTSATLDRALATASIAAAAICSVAAPLILRVVFGPSFAGAAPTLVWTAIGMVPALTNSARKVALIAAGRETLVVRWSAVALALQAVAAAALIPTVGSIGAALAIGIAEAGVWLPLRAALTGGAATRLPHKWLRTARP